MRGERRAGRREGLADALVAPLVARHSPVGGEAGGLIALRVEIGRHVEGGRRDHRTQGRVRVALQLPEGEALGELHRFDLLSRVALEQVAHILVLDRCQSGAGLPCELILRLRLLPQTGLELRLRAPEGQVEIQGVAQASLQIVRRVRRGRPRRGRVLVKLPAVTTLLVLQQFTMRLRDAPQDQAACAVEPHPHRHLPSTGDHLGVEVGLVDELEFFLQPLCLPRHVFVGAAGGFHGLEVPPVLGVHIPVGTRTEEFLPGRLLLCLPAGDFAQLVQELAAVLVPDKGLVGLGALAVPWQLVADEDVARLAERDDGPLRLGRTVLLRALAKLVSHVCSRQHGQGRCAEAPGHGRRNRGDRQDPEQARREGQGGAGV